MPCVALPSRRSTLVETQYDARIDSGPTLALPCVVFLRLVVKKSPTFLVINLCVSQINATQGLAALCEPAFMTPQDRFYHDKLWIDTPKYCQKLPRFISRIDYCADFF